MPLPTPKKDEKQDYFMARCMGDPTMRNEFPDEKQRDAVCLRQFKNAPKATTQNNDKPV